MDALSAAVGAGDWEERRSELLWRHARGKLESAVAKEVAAHVAACADCRDALEAERLVAAGVGDGRVVLARCPSSEEMLLYLEKDSSQSPWRRLEIKMHVEKCGLCREETSWAASRVAAPPKPASEAPAEGRAAGFWIPWNWAWGAAAAVVVLAAALAYPNWFGPSRYAKYARIPDMPYEAVLSEFARAHPDDLPRFRTAAQHIQLGEYSQGAQILGELETRFAGDPSITFFRGYVALREGRWEEAALLCTRAEKGHTLGGFRCWYLANVALRAGHLDIARKELHHAKGHPEYAEGVKRLEQVVN